MKSRTTYFLQQYLHEHYMHGGIGFVDVERIWHHMGFKAVRLNKKEQSGFWVKITRCMYLVYWLFKIKKGDTLAFIFPCYATLEPLLVKWLSRKGVDVICLIGDINGLRLLDNGLLKKELDYLSNFKKFIVHNDRMGEFINLKLDNKITKILGCFDFLTTAQCSYSHSLGYEIAYAGNLEKSAFLAKLTDVVAPASKITINLYGQQLPSLQYINGLNYKGFFPPAQVLENLQGSFGLIWDGDSIDSCVGPYGEYVAYNSPHKFSMYILAGIPMLVWENAAIAQVVKKYNIGKCVNSLGEIQSVIQRITTSEYEQMKLNIISLQAAIRNGDHIKVATAELLGC